MMLDFGITEWVSISLLVLIFGLMAADDIRLRIKSKRMLKTIIEITLDKMTLENYINSYSSPTPEAEDFIKFLSESREWAFEYIENVQATISSLSKSMESNKEEDIDRYYQELMTFLPEKNN